MLYLCWKNNIRVSIENPERSWLWEVLALLVKEYEDLDFLRWLEKLDKSDFSHVHAWRQQSQKHTPLGDTRSVHNVDGTM